MTLPPNYDQWRLSGPFEQTEVGTEDGDECGRYFEIDEDAPRGYRPKRCRGEMIKIDGVAWCDTCGEIAT